ncbi:MAG: hypothetical protein WBD02_01005 [Acidimicrobiia bacterium]
MGWIVAILVFLLVCGIAAAIIAREAVRSSRQPEPPVIVLDEAYQFIADRLPDEVAATLTPDDLRALLADATDILGEHQLDVSPEVVRAAERSGRAPEAGDPLVLDGALLSSELISRATLRGERLIPEQTEPVVGLLFEYFRRVGVSGIPAEPS